MGQVLVAIAELPSPEAGKRLTFLTNERIHRTAGSAAVWLAGYVHDLTGTYRLALIGGTAGALCALVMVWVVAPDRARFSPAFFANRSSRCS